MRVIDTLIVFRILKMLTTPFNKMQAYKFGFIDERGNRIKYLPNPDNPNVKERNDPITTEEKNSLTPLHRLVFNLKRIIEKVPFGKSAFASYAVALLLLKEETDLDDRQAEELYEKFYRHLKDQEKLEPEQIEEAISVTTLNEGVTYNLKRQLKQNDLIYPERTSIVVESKYEVVFGIHTYVATLNEDRVLVTQDDVY
jgi:hypothetical protein|tara:strand:+ start:721 stop:1314 length:594 start_codon:yes stop_codon:yes gene_type:complete